MSLITSLTMFFINLDSLVNAKVVFLQAPMLTKLMLVITSLGSSISMLILSLFAFGFLAYKKRWRNAFLFIFGMIGALISELLIKAIVHRARPENALVHAADYSFPSGHATMALIFFSLAIYLLKDDIKKELWKHLFVISCIVLTLLIGFSRIYLNVHWFSDVIGGFALGLFWLSITILISKMKKPAEDKTT